MSRRHRHGKHGRHLPRAAGGNAGTSAMHVDGWDPGQRVAGRIEFAAGNAGHGAAAPEPMAVALPEGVSLANLNASYDARLPNGDTLRAIRTRCIAAAEADLAGAVP